MKLTASFLLLLCQMAYSQTNDLPYAQIPDYPEDYGSGNVLSRLVDGLGFRYYWATEGLREADLNYKPSAEARTTKETMMHILGLSNTIVNAAKNVATVRGQDLEKLTYEELRRMTLENLQDASKTYMGKSSEEVNELMVIFESEDNRSEYAFWHMINGPISDAIWHTGQIVSFRRASGNPFNSKVSVFQGRLRE